jgi:predicted HAD superfamily Cof-like phosphohydrolase
MYDATNEDNMLAEELEELSLARSNYNVNEMVDAYCDLIVLATGAIHKLGFDPTESMAETLLEINSRKGSVDPLTGKWQKDKSQDPFTLYKANYDNAKY